MTHDEITHLASLARIRISEAEATVLAGDFETILQYVAQINDAVGNSVDSEPRVPPHANVFRADEVTVPAGSYTKVLLNAAPKRRGRYIEVKKILGGSDE